ncbi:MAG: ABC transporter ATP-binding protein [Oricola sp.]|nr:MAG: ABC transporter ATP-binding protein [Oricola sp.]
MSNELLSATDIHVAFAGVKAADGVSLSIDNEEFVAIIGPNGSGKTTFLNICTGYIKPQKGEVRLAGQPITGLAPRRIARQGIARAFQIPQLFAEHTLVENVCLAIASRQGLWGRLRPLLRSHYVDEAMELLGLLGLKDHAHRPASEMPEGVKKLADVVLALAMKPRLLLLDEPTSGVSAIERFRLMDALMSALREVKLTAVFVEHDMEVVRDYADKVVVWNNGQILTTGHPSHVFEDERVKTQVVGV